MTQSPYLSGPRIDPARIGAGMSITELVDGTFQAYNAGRMREACQLLARRMLEDDVTVGLAVTGALTPAGLGMSALIPLVEAGFVDWIVSTGANLYHDTHFGIGLPLHQGSPHVSDVVLLRDEVVRIYDVFLDFSVLLDTDEFFWEIIGADEFQRTMSTAEFHYLCGRYVAERERALGLGRKSLLAAAWEHAVPVYTPAPGDSTIGMNVAAKALRGNRLAFDVNADVNETAAIVLDAKRRGGKSAIWILGGGSPKNFALQTEPQIREVMGMEERGHDYFLQITDARPDTGGLSGATPAEAVSWGKVDPEMLPNAVTAYVDSTIALPLLTAYALENRAPRTPRRLMDRRGAMLERLAAEFDRFARDEAAQQAARDYAAQARRAFTPA
ncbi:MAG TPA: deoxyhypusine synthase [Longimicrobium sp.]|jgi:deoxyhypusine synthase|uniref:homospermidine biosynthesis protein n=1 Tax=Longimicrobium sp. TaxID=2029185 RepID=UPI002ED83D54